MNYKESITALLEGLKGIFENKTATEASAIAQAATKPSTIFYTSDTHAIVVGGQVYGRSNQVSADAPFAYLPADLASPAADPQFDGNHDTIYIQPIKTGADAGKIKLWWYVNGAWTSTDTLDLVLPTEASQVTYELTNTPDLGSGDVQSAIEALDGKVEQVAEDVVRTGYLIASWEDDKILTSTTYAVGSTIGDWATNARYGSRGVRLNVKEGDKVLLDTYSPALFGLIFTDENRVVKALYDDRRFDGVWTAPCDGYCYIQDVLYRENYHYASAHGHLAYMAYDAMNKLKGKQDWFNQYSPTLRAQFPKTFTTTFTGNDGSSWQPKLDLYSPASKIFQIWAIKVKINIDMSDEPDARLNPRMASSSYISLPSWYFRDTEVGEEKWLPCMHDFGTNQINQSNLIVWLGNLVNGHTYSVDVLDAYHHDFDDYKQARTLFDGILDGSIIPNGDIVGKDTDILRNAIGLQSISDLGYNILDHGATLPIDEDGYKYAKELYDRYKDNPPSGNIRALFANDEKLVYFPNIDLSHATTIGGSTSNSLFMNCHNLKVIPPLNLTGNLACGYTIQGCRSLKRIKSLGDLKVTGGAANFLCANYALEYVGKIDTSECTSFWGLLGNAYSLKRIEELDLGKVSQWGSSGFVSWPSNAPVLEYMLIKNIFRLPSQTTHIFSGAPKWGINSDENPDARQSLVNSLLTYSYDRVNDPDGLGTAGTTCTITLSANTYSQLTELEIEQITAKGYTLTHP